MLGENNQQALLVKSNSIGEIIQRCTPLQLLFIFFFFFVKETVS